MFNRYGNIPELPQDISKAKKAYWEAIKPYLDKMTIVEVRAFQQDTDLWGEFSQYIIKRQTEMRKKDKV